MCTIVCDCIVLGLIEISLVLPLSLFSQSGATSRHHKLRDEMDFDTADQNNDSIIAREYQQRLIPLCTRESGPESDRQGKPSPVVRPWFVDLHHDRRSCMSSCAVKRRRLSVTHDALAGAASLACRAHRSHVMPIGHVASVDGNMRSGR